MSAGYPVFKADSVDALHAGAVFADEYGTCRYGACEQFRRSDFADAAVVYPDAVYGFVYIVLSPQPMDADAGVKKVGHSSAGLLAVLVMASSDTPGNSSPSAP